MMLQRYKYKSMSVVFLRTKCKNRVKFVVIYGAGTLLRKNPTIADGYFWVTWKMCVCFVSLTSTHIIGHMVCALRQVADLPNQAVFTLSLYLSLNTRFCR